MSVYRCGRPAKFRPSLKQGSKPPAKPGEYRIRNNAGEITYVGETNNLNRRMNEHLRNGKMSNGQNEGGSFEWKVADGRSSSRTRRIHEQEKIHQHKPCMNCSIGGEGRIARRKRV